VKGKLCESWPPSHVWQCSLLTVTLTFSWSLSELDETRSSLSRTFWTICIKQSDDLLIQFFVTKIVKWKGKNTSSCWSVSRSLLCVFVVQKVSCYDLIIFTWQPNSSHVASSKICASFSFLETSAIDSLVYLPQYCAGFAQCISPHYNLSPLRRIEI